MPSGCVVIIETATRFVRAYLCSPRTLLDPPVPIRLHGSVPPLSPLVVSVENTSLWPPGTAALASEISPRVLRVVVAAGRRQPRRWRRRRRRWRRRV